MDCNETRTLTKRTNDFEAQCAENMHHTHEHEHRHLARLYLQEKNRLRCQLCSHHCLIAAGQRGLCAVRENQEGTLYTLVYGQVAAEGADPVEKKPLYHFLPGSRTWSIATRGCNFRCQHCQNHTLSQVHPRENPAGHYRSPRQVVAMVRAKGCTSLSYTYSEPTIFFEFAEDCALLARDQGLANIFVSNGYMSAQAAERAGKWLDAANIDIKAFTEDFYQRICGARLAPVLETVQRLHDLGIWLEVTTLIIPGLNDSEEELLGLAQFLCKISSDIPWHLSAFHPAYRLMNAARTPVDILLKAREIGYSAGLNHVYLGNVALPGAADTRCPGCGELFLARQAMQTETEAGARGACRSCGRHIAGRWE
jgi:pyruvate formate lyase activating enzyme